MAVQSKKFAFVLSGGSIKGAFEAGAIAKLLEEGCVPSAIYGVSVGGLNGAFVADRAARAGQTVDWRKIGSELESFWTEKLTSFDAIGDARSAVTIGWNVLRDNFNGLVDVSALRKLVHAELDEERIRRSPVRLCVGVTNLASGRCDDVDANTPNFMDHVVASCMVPVVMPIGWVGNQPLVDGGVVHVTPLKAAAQSNAEEIVCVMCQPENLSSVNFDTRNVLKLTDRLMDVVVNTLNTNDVEWFKYINDFCPADGSTAKTGPFTGCRRVPLTTIRPTASLNVDLEDFTAADVRTLISLGKDAATRALRARESTRPVVELATERATAVVGGSV